MGYALGEDGLVRVCNAVSQELISICVAECVVRVRGFKFRVLATLTYEDGLVIFLLTKQYAISIYAFLWASDSCNYLLYFVYSPRPE